jgi:hypothetical protein
MLHGDGRVRSSTSSLLALVALGSLGCGSSLTPADGGGDTAQPGVDGGDAPQHDPAACGCRIDTDGTLIMSWDCFCASQGCNATGCRGGTGYLACGLTVSVQQGAAGPDLYVTDASGKLVGVQHTADIGFFSCPSDPSLTGGRMRAGQFPDASCNQVSCACPIGEQQCVPPVDGGTSDGCDCQVSNGSMTVSWDCYCRTWGCDGRLACSAGQQRTDYPGCGLTVVSRQSFGTTSSVYDSSGALVGQTIQSDTTPYSCPTNSALSASEVRAGQAPAASCAAIACGACTTAAFPCAAPAGAAP